MVNQVETLKIYGKYYGECVHAQWGSGNEEEYHTLPAPLHTGHFTASAISFYLLRHIL